MALYKESPLRPASGKDSALQQAAPGRFTPGTPPLSFCLGDPDGVFRFLAWVLAPLSVLRHLVWPLAALAGLAALFNWYPLQTHLARIALTTGFLQSFLISLLVTNLLAKLLQGSVMAHHGARCGEFGVMLLFGVLPKFYIVTTAVKLLGFRAQRRCYASPLLYRLGVCGSGLLSWAILLPTGAGLADVCLAVGVAGLISFVLTANPLFPADGYHWLAALLCRPKLRSQGFRVLGMVARRQPMPPTLPRSEFWLLVLFATGSLVLTFAIIAWVVVSVAFLLELELRGTGVILVCGLLAGLGLFLSGIIRRIRGQRPARTLRRR